MWFIVVLQQTPADVEMTGYVQDIIKAGICSQCPQYVHNVIYIKGTSGLIPTDYLSYLWMQTEV